MNTLIDTFKTWLGSELTHFVSLIEEGSTVTGDPWQEGFSDHDMTIVVTAHQDTEMAAVGRWLSENPFDNTYLFGPRLAHEFVHGDSLNDISMKFRAKTVFGRDLVAEKDMPDRARAREIGKQGLRGLEMRCVRRLLNLSHWTSDYAAKKNYEIFKDFFVFSAALIYGETGTYPTKRSDVVSVLASSFDAMPLLHVTNDILNATNARQRVAFEHAIAYVRGL